MFYIELNPDNNPQTVLVSAFRQATMRVATRAAILPIKTWNEVPDPDAVIVSVAPGGKSGYLQPSTTDYQLPIGYEDFKALLLRAREKNEIPSFKDFKYAP